MISRIKVNSQDLTLYNFFFLHNKITQINLRSCQRILEREIYPNNRLLGLKFVLKITIKSQPGCLVFRKIKTKYSSIYETLILEIIDDGRDIYLAVFLTHLLIKSSNTFHVRKGKILSTFIWWNTQCVIEFIGLSWIQTLHIRFNEIRWLCSYDGCLRFSRIKGVCEASLSAKVCSNIEILCPITKGNN